MQAELTQRLIAHHGGVMSHIDRLMADNKALKIKNFELVMELRKTRENTASVPNGYKNDEMSAKNDAQ